MDGVAAVRTVLVADLGLVALVPAEKVVAGVLPLSTVLPGIALTSISRREDSMLAPDGFCFVQERVQVTVLARDYPTMKRVLRAVRRAAADQIDPPVAGITDVTIHTDGTGPDIIADDTNIHQGTQDFSVSYNEER